jgi:hypothetical protein
MRANGWHLGFFPHAGRNCHRAISGIKPSGPVTKRRRVRLARVVQRVGPPSMRLPSISARLIAFALFALSGGRAVAQSEGKSAVPPVQVPAAVRPASDGKGTKSAATTAAKDQKKAAPSAADIRKLYDEIGKQRDVMIAEFEGLAKQMKDATEEQKKQIKAKMEAQKKAFEEVTNALHKQIREEQRKQRQNAAPAKR